jgi:hypothetical protein
MWHSKETEQERQGGTLNVVFHGMWAFVPRPYGVEVVAPKVLGHTYRAGTWCAEQDLSFGECYYLEGVRPNESNVEVSGSSNIILPGPLADDYQSGIFCTWVLPRPWAFHSVRRMPIGPQWFRGPEQSRRYVDYLRELALVQVLCYPFDEPNSISIRQLSRCGAELPWDKLFDKETRTVNLHVFAEEPMGLPGKWMNLLHPTLAFSQAAKLVDLDLGFQYPATWEGPAELPDSGVAGVPSSQVSSLPERGIVVSSSPVGQLGPGYGPVHGDANCSGMIVVKLPIPLPDPFLPVGTIIDDGFAVTYPDIGG